MFRWRAGPWWPSWDGEELRVWPSTQSPHEIKPSRHGCWASPTNRIRVEFGDVGGGFGQKMYPSREDAAVLLAAKMVGRPVKWTEDRRENLIAANQARHDIATVTVATDDDGRFLAATFHLLEGVGSYPPGGGTRAGGMLVAMMFTGPYRIPKIGFSSQTVFTNTCGKAPFRGPWAIETIAREQMVDAVAHELGLDPLELRRRNVIHQSDLPYTTSNGIVYDIVTPEETLEQADLHVRLGGVPSPAGPPPGAAGRYSAAVSACASSRPRSPSAPRPPKRPWSASTCRARSR